ncbi:minor capsid protein [Metabacillus herbersteinensis]|uniref:Minor capsid protein n=1 Tax=Metabacillus herbersteinensis TaxID=283816 RepID=A0ABV6GBS3_9BACI
MAYQRIGLVRINVKVELKMQSVLKKAKDAKEAAQAMLDFQVLKDSNNYIPFRENYLAKSGIFHSLIGQGHIEWNTPYARRLYYNPQYNFSKDKNPNAQGLWFEAAKALHGKEWAETAGVPYSKIFKEK